MTARELLDKLESISRSGYELSKHKVIVLDKNDPKVRITPKSIFIHKATIILEQ